MRKWRKYSRQLLVHYSVAVLWLLLVWLSYSWFPNQPAARIALSRVILLGIVIQLLVLAGQQRRQVISIVQRFFTAATQPINLAVFRIVFFWSLFNSINTAEVVWFSQLPSELKFPPTGLEWLLSYLPINQTLAGISSTLLRVFSLTAMIGLFTRTSAVLTVVLGVYALGIPQFFGKVNHYHHLLWFAAILAASRCADVFSCDAVWRAWRRADRGVIEPPAASQVYALPLRFVWLLIGIIYFFPGFWKVCLSGFDWAFSENFKFQLYNKWAELDGWMPFFRLDQYPLLYKLSAFGAILFELSFIFLIFLPRLRLIAALGGIIFHLTISAFMNINSFWTLQASYVAFLNWHTIFRRIGRRFYQKDMYLIYDGNCQLCRRTIASLRVFDIFGRVTYVNALDDSALASQQLNWLNPATIMADMHVVVQRKAWIGFSAYRVLARRIPILWPVLPLLYVWPIPKIGKQIYRRVADARTCSVTSSAPKATNYQYHQRPNSRAVILVGIFLLFVNSLYGITGIYRSWPFALYPPFAILAEAQRESLEIVPLDASGETIPFDQQALKQKFSSDRYIGITSSILGTGKQALRQQFASSQFEGVILSILGSVDSPAQSRARLNALWQVAVQNDPKLQRADSVRFYKLTQWTTPDRQAENPVDRQLLFELKL